MTALLSWDDYRVEDGEEGGVWVDLKVRALVPHDVLRRQGYRTATLGNPGAWQIELVGSAQLGLPVECECGLVAIRFGVTGQAAGEPFYPFGSERYGTNAKGERRELRVPGQYCPHCDGGEDMG